MEPLFLITMYNEFSVVRNTVSNIRKEFSNALIFVVQSDNGSGNIIESVDRFEVLPDLSKEYRHHKLAANAIARNYSYLFKKSLELDCLSKTIVAITGDTLITDPSVIMRIDADMRRQNKVLACSQALGQNFHAVDSDPENGRCGGRFQFEGISDFMPQFFVVSGAFVAHTRAFENIEVVNEFTSEQCLGDEFQRCVKGLFSDNALVLSKNAYDFSDGINYQVRF